MTAISLANEASVLIPGFHFRRAMTLIMVLAPYVSRTDRILDSNIGTGGSEQPASMSNRTDWSAQRCGYYLGLSA
jgi:hypothetical protein